ncbi:MAG: Rrf2 family transcriptional regulator [Ferruginibacter sp.]|nr:Rrf2 family transcriptional regulator [Ferruginibacter sp.]
MLSNKTIYGLKALGYLAKKYGDGPILISEIAKEKKIPLKFLESILLLLKKNNILESKKGKGGGYYLAVSPKKVSIAQAIRIIEGPIALVHCVSLNFYEKCEDCNETNCGLRKTMTEVRDATLRVLTKKNLTHLSDGFIC